MSRPQRGVLDTSVFIARESSRPLESGRLPAELAVSVVTVAELQAGVLAARDLDARSRRLATLDLLSDIEILTIDERVAAEWARLRVHLAERSRRAGVNDVWIAATALTHGLAVVTQDDDFEPMRDAGLEIVRV